MDENETTELQPTPVKAEAVAEAPQMSELSMIGNVFIEPGRVFDDQRRKPRFIVGGILIILAFSVFQVIFIQKFGFEQIARACLEANKRVADLPTDQKEKLIEQQTGPVAKYISYGILPVAMIVVFLLGGLIYWLGANAMGGSGTFLGGISVWIYSSIPPVLVFAAANIIVMFLKDPDTIDLATAQGGLLKANLGFFLDQKTMPTLFALLSSIDLFAIWGWVLASIGLQRRR